MSLLGFGVQVTTGISIIFLLNMILAFVVIFFERKHPSSTWAWIMVLLLIPVVGFILYLLFSQNLSKRKLFKLRKEEEEVTTRMKEHQLKNINEGKIQFKDPSMSQYKDMIRMNLLEENAVLSQDNHIEIFKEGEGKFKELIECIKNAKDHIHIMYYIFRRDELGMRIVNALIEKAREGVEVRFIYDAIGSKFVKRKSFKDLQEAGGKVELFFPSSIPIINPKVNYRNHRKIVVIDGEIGFVGGFNVGNEYLGLDKKLGYWRDTHLKIKGGGVGGLQSRFILDWRFASHEPMDDLHRYFPMKTCDGQAGIQIVSSGPDSQKEQIKYGYIKMINEAKKNVYIQTPYFIPDESMLEALKIAALSGIDVKIMIPNKPDHIFVYWASYSYVGDLLDAGAEVYLYEKGFLHAKTCVIDGKVASVGTANLDNRSFRLNFEVNAFIYDRKTAKELEDIFMEDLKECRKITKEEYKNRSSLIKFKESISRLIGPLL
ncbi:cardiolipin synthase [Anaeromicrobium sediminis]|uniref:Cardiolipin synthase n=1 Tax=Anaeromicrobium sediminis TaxID=1478221 RepID=A0A267MEB7_9FIRM|nr:cardiolipin synthase [Anaeromicrobium sediminis]PAB57742.1 cardiolipin synthase [Anaeromicrobium sediminis]